MPVALTYPGVYIQEIPSGARSISGVATSIAAFVGNFSRGPLDTPVRMFHVGDFEKHMGGVERNSETSYAVSQFYANGGGEAIAIRVGGGTTGSMEVESWDGAASLVFDAGRQFQDQQVDDPGSWNNHIRVDIDYLTSDPANLFNLSVTEINHVDGLEVPVRSEVYRNVSMVETHSRYVVSVVNDDSQMVFISKGTVGNSMPAPTGYYSGVQTIANYAGMADNNAMDIDLGNGTTLSVALDATTKPTTIAEAALMLQNAIRDTQPADPLWAQCQVVARGDRIAIYTGRNSTDYRAGQVVSIADTAGDFGAVTGLAGSGEANVQQYAMNTAAPAGFQSAATAGANGAAPTAAQLRGNRNLRTGIYALEDVDLFNLLVIPEASGLGSVANLSSVMSPAISYCEEQRAFLLIDPPPDANSTEEAIAWLDEAAGAGLRHRNTAAFYPSVQIPDPQNDNRLRTIAPSGTIAGLMARKDGDEGVWTAAAGITASLRNVISFNHTMTNNEIGQLNPIGLIA